jgi:hypothetical protein
LPWRRRRGLAAICRSLRGVPLTVRDSPRPTDSDPAGRIGHTDPIRTLCISIDPVDLDDHHAFAADIGEVDEHKPTQLHSPQSGRIAGEVPPVEEDHRLADSQFLG